MKVQDRLAGLEPAYNVIFDIALTIELQAIDILNILKKALQLFLLPSVLS